MKGFRRLSVLAGVGLLAACGSSGGDGIMGGPSSSGSGNTAAGTNSNPTAGNSPGGSSSGTGGNSTAGNGTSGSSTAAGSGMGGSGMAGNATAGAGGDATAGGGSGGAGGGGGDDVAHPLKIDATMDLHTHTVAGNHPAGVDTRLPKIVGKLIVNVEVDKAASTTTASSTASTCWAKTSSIARSRKIPRGT